MSLTPDMRAAFQSAWVVRDLEAAAKRWSDALGVGPFFRARYRPGDFASVRYRGGPGELAMDTAITYAGDQQIELIRPVSDAPSPYNDTVPRDRDGFHHVCIWSRDVGADCERYAALGYPAAMRATVRGTRQFAYIDTHSALGCMIELLSFDEAIAAAFASWKQQCADWDGESLFIER